MEGMEYLMTVPAEEELALRTRFDEWMAAHDARVERWKRWNWAAPILASTVVIGGGWFLLNSFAATAAQEAVQPYVAVFDNMVGRVVPAVSEAESARLKAENLTFQLKTIQSAAESASREATTAKDNAQIALGEATIARDSAFEVADEASKRRSEFKQVDALLSTLKEGEKAAAKLVDGQARDAMERAVRVGLESLIAPVGSVVAWPCPNKPPDNWRSCNGAWLRKSNHELLWQRLGEGDVYGKRINERGEPEFRLPDYQGYFLRGAGKVRGYEGQHAAGPLGKPQAQSVEAHKHGGVLRRAQRIGAQLACQHTELGSTQHDATGNNTGSHTDANTGDETRPINVAVHWVIRVK